MRLEITPRHGIECIGREAYTQPSEVLSSEFRYFRLLSVDAMTNYSDFCYVLEQDKGSYRSMSKMGSALNQTMKIG